MIVLQDNKKSLRLIEPRLIVPVFFVLSLSSAALYYVLTSEDKTSGDITFTDSIGSPLKGVIELNGAGISSGLKQGADSISWTNIPNARIYFNAFNTKGVSVNLVIAGDSPKSKIILENFGNYLPGNAKIFAPGVPIKYVEISTTGVSFAEAEISIQYTDTELRGLEEKTLAIYRYDSGSLTWSELPTKIDEKNNILSATVNSLSVFAASAKGQKIEIRDLSKTSVVSDIKTYDEAKNLRKKAEKTDTLLASDVSDKGDVEIDALSSKNVAVKLKIDRVSGGEVILDDYGRNNPVPVPLPGKAIKFVEISASNISYSSAEVTIRYSEAELEGVDENSLRIYHWNGAAWEALATQVDVANNLLRATTTSLSAFGVAAPGGAARLIAFTDKKVYTAWWMDARTGTPAFWKLDDEGQTIYIYAFLLDSDGNIIKGNTTIQVTLNDTVFDHYQKGDWTVHNAIAGTNTYFTTTKSLNDTGTFNDSQANDGIYTATIAINSTLLSDVQTGTPPPRVDDQVRIKLDVRDTASGLNTTTYVLVSWGKCHQAGTTSHPTAHVAATIDLCTVCHGGNEHFFENVSNTIPYEYLDIHFKKLGNSLPDSTMINNGMEVFNWNSTQDDGLAPYGTNASWKLRSGGGAVYCLFCHDDPAGSNWFDYGLGDRTNLADRPSCGQGSSGYSGNCHSRTEIENTSVINWTQNASVVGNDTLVNINKQKSHNHTTNTANVSCTLCHAGPHGLTMPNMSADISSSGNINNQCVFCHNISGGYLNITSNGGTAVAHSSTNCKACHKDASSKLDVHSVPTAAMVNCTNCHNVGGTATGKLVNFTSMNRSMHANLNKNATSASQNVSNKPCWACHGTINGTYANESDQPLNSHNETVYRNPRKCQDCHNDTISRLSEKYITFTNFT